MIEVQPNSSGKAGFTIQNPLVTGVTFTNELRGDAYLTNAVAHNGAGVALGDVDGDGLVDIYLCNLQGPNRLYRNLGNWRFEPLNIGVAACEGQFSTGTTFADVDGDSDLDLLVNGISVGTRLFLNDGKGRWSEIAESGLSRTNSATSMALADIDGDCDLDLYCAHYSDVMNLFDPLLRFGVARRGDQWIVTKVNGQPATLPQWANRFVALPDGRVRELPEAHALYRNDGGGHFTAIQNSAFLDNDGKSILAYRDWGLAVMFRDLNGDGAPDIYVCNDNASPDRIWINSGNGTFRAAGQMMFRHTSRSSMGIDFADINRDGYDDFIVVDMLAREHAKRMTQLVKDYPNPLLKDRMDERPEYNRNTLFFGCPDGTFYEAALMAGVAATDWSWCPIFLDVDLDGYEDLLVTSGFAFDVLDQDGSDARRANRRFTATDLNRFFGVFPSWPTKNTAMRNRGDGTFEAMDEKWGFAHEGISNGMAVGDLDNDGDLDVVVNNLNDIASLYRNDSGAGRIAVRLKGPGVGAKIRLTGGSVTQTQEMLCGGRYLSSDQQMRVFAANGAGPFRIEVRWRDGSETIVTNAQANRIYEVSQIGASLRERSVASEKEKPFFKDVSSSINHTHHELDFDDATRQPSLPRKLSKLGPGVTWYDLDGDGWEDLFLTAGRDGKLSAFLNEQGDRFRVLDGGVASKGDQMSVVGWADGKGSRELLVALSNLETSPGQNSEILIYSQANLTAPRILPAGAASIGPLAVGDVDGDGDLDLFAGGRFVPGRFPEPCAGMLWINDGGELQGGKLFESVGMISGALFADLDGDGQLDLVLANEWGPVRVFRNRQGKFEEVTSQWGLEQMTGCWSAIAAGDFDGDGRIDLALGNWGRNTEYELYQPTTLRIFYDDANSDGILETAEAWRRGDQWLPVRDRLHLSAALPDLARRFTNHLMFASATIPQILGERFQQARFVEANHLESMVLLNRGGRFEARPLPREAQLAPVNAVNVGDFDGDGNEDLFLSQNFFGTVSDINRDDNGRGLWLRGKGDGSFEPVDATVSGVNMYGEQRGAALADFNQDGRVDLAVSQNSAETKVYLNERAKRGLRVKLSGPTSNPDGFGAEICVIYPGNRKGPRRLYNGAVQVLGLKEAPESLWIRHVGGKEQLVPIEKDSLNINVRIQ